MAEITNYLDRIDAKVDDVLGKVDDTVLKDMRGARLQIRRAQTMRDQEGRVTSNSWSEVQNASGKLADVQGYALLQLEAIANKLESKKRVGGLAAASEEAKPEVQKWLAVLADCFRLQESFDVLALDKAMDESPAALNARRRGLEADRKDRLGIHLQAHHEPADSDGCSSWHRQQEDALTSHQVAGNHRLWQQPRARSSGVPRSARDRGRVPFMGSKAAWTRRGSGLPGHPEIEGRSTRCGGDHRARGYGRPRRKCPRPRQGIEAPRSMAHRSDVTGPSRRSANK